MSRKDNKKGFILYADYAEHIRLLPDAEAGKLFKAIFSYVNEEEPEELSPLATMAFSFIRAQLDRDLAHWIETSEKRAASGRLGGMVKRKQNEANKANAISDKQNEANKANAISDKQNEANKADIDKVNDTVTGTENEITDEYIPAETVKGKVKMPKHKYGNYQRVKLTDAERGALITEYGKTFFEACIKELDEYKQQTGKKYNDDNLAIRKWVIDAVKKKGGESGGSIKTEQRSEYDKINL